MVFAIPPVSNTFVVQYRCSTNSCLARNNMRSMLSGDLAFCEYIIAILITFNSTVYVLGSSLTLS
jgi:hypothetical protein